MRSHPPRRRPQALENNAGVIARLDLKDVNPDHAQVRLPGDLTGPSASYAAVAKHPRFRGLSQSEWRDAAPQHHGRDTAYDLNYSMESRAAQGKSVCTQQSYPGSLKFKKLGCN